eukprot:scaffold8.g1486.t1
MAAPAHPATQPLLILYASQTGNAQDVAERIGRLARPRHFAPRVLPADTFLPCVAELPAQPAIVFVASTTGQGEPPTNMHKLWRFLLRKSLPADSMSAVGVAIFGLGDSGTDTPRPARRRLEALGAQPLLPLGLGDDQHRSGYEAGLDAWLPQLWAALRRRFPLPPGISEPPHSDTSAELVPKYRVRVLYGLEAEAAAGATLAAQQQRQQCCGADAAHAAAIAAARVLDALEAAASGLLPGAAAEAGRSMRSAGGHATTAGAGADDGADGAGGGYGPQRPLFARLLANRRVTAPDHFQDVRHLEIDLSTPEGGALAYQPGDVLAIVPRQPAAVVEQLCARCGLDPTAWVRIELAEDPSAAAADEPAAAPGCAAHAARPGAAVQVGPLIAGALDIAGAAPRRLLFEVLAALATSEVECERLQYLSGPEGRDELWEYNQREGRTLLEVLHDFRSATPPLEWLLQAAQRLKPRLFSCASSQALHPGRAHLTVAIVEWVTPYKRRRRGVCTSWFANLRPSSSGDAGDASGGTRLPVWVERGALRMPQDPGLPLIMVGPGTGVAPFRAFLQERQVILAAATGTPPVPCVLVFGCRSERGDFYYREEWEAMQAAGVLAPPPLGLLTAFSRDQARKVYVQQRVEECGAELWALLEGRRACVYMPAQVMAVFERVAAQHGGLAAEEAGRWLRQLELSGRYQAPSGVLCAAHFNQTLFLAQSQGLQVLSKGSSVSREFPLADGAGWSILWAQPVAEADERRRPLFLAVMVGGRGQRAAALLQPVQNGGLQLVDRAPLLAEPPATPQIDLLRPQFSLHTVGGSAAADSLATGASAATSAQRIGILIAAIAESCLHVVEIRRRPGQLPTLACSCQPLCQLLAADEGATVVVEALALGPASSYGGRGDLLAALVYSAHPLGGAASIRSAACLALGADHSLSIGPCFVRRARGHATHPGVLLVSGRGAQLLQLDGPFRLQLSLNMEGAVPTAAVCLGGTQSVLIADSASSLHLIDCQRGTARRVDTNTPLPIASCLAFLPRWLPSGTSAVLVGSASGTSALVEVPSYLGSRWEVQPEALLPTLAPVRGAALMRDPSCGDTRLVCCCGEAPRGRLAIAWLAAGLQPLVEGPQIPGLVRLIPLRLAPGSGHHSHLLLSFDEEGSTLVLAAHGSSFAEASLPGLATHCATLLATPMPAGRLLQVTPQQAQVTRLADGGLVSSWRPAGPISLAALHGSFLALASGSDVQVLYVSHATGKLQEDRRLVLEQQASSLALFELPEPGSEGASCIWLAAGLWVANAVVLQQLAAEVPTARLDLGRPQPRSLVVAEVGGTTRLFVGTSTGELLWWDMRPASAPASGPHLELTPAAWVRVGLAPVELQPLAPSLRGRGGATVGTGGRASAADGSSQHVLARSDQALVVGPGSADPTALRALRLHGGQGMAAACPFQAEALPLDSLAWVGPGGRLTFGQLDCVPRCRWEDVPLPGAAPTLVAYHAASGCAAVACSAADGSSSSLRLLDLSAVTPSMEQVGRLPLSGGHVITAVGVVALPCSGVEGGSKSGGESGRPGSKEFLLVASTPGGSIGGSTGDQQSAAVLEDGASSGWELPAAATPGAPSEPWWRQPTADPDAETDGDSRGVEAAQQRDGADHGAPAEAADGPPAAAVEASPRDPPGLLSIFELTRAPSSSSAGRPQRLLLHGTVPLRSACYSLAGVLPAAEPLSPEPYTPPPARHAGGAAGSGRCAAADRVPLLVLGCYDGVRLCRVFVDDGGREAELALERGLAAVAVEDPLQLGGEDGRDGGTGTADGACASAGSQEDAGKGAAGDAPPRERQQVDPAVRRLWHHRVAMQQLGWSRTYDDGVVVQLSVCGSMVYAGDLVSGLTAFCVQSLTPDLPPTLVPLSADASGRARLPLLALSEERALVALHPQGLAVLQRDSGAEQVQQASAKERRQRALELGRRPGHARAAGSRRSSGIRLFASVVEDAARLVAVASCGAIPANIASLVPGELGVAVCPLADFLAGSSARGESVSCGAAAETVGTAAVVVTTAGTAPRATRSLAEAPRSAHDPQAGSIGAPEVADLFSLGSLRSFADLRPRLTAALAALRAHPGRAPAAAVAAFARRALTVWLRAAPVVAVDQSYGTTVHKGGYTMHPGAGNAKLAAVRRPGCVAPEPLLLALELLAHGSPAAATTKRTSRRILDAMVDADMSGWTIEQHLRALAALQAAGLQTAAAASVTLARRSGGSRAAADWRRTRRWRCSRPGPTRRREGEAAAERAPKDAAAAHQANLAETRAGCRQLQALAIAAAASMRPALAAQLAGSIRGLEGAAVAALAAAQAPAHRQSREEVALAACVLAAQGGWAD